MKNNGGFIPAWKKSVRLRRYFFAFKKRWAKRIAQWKAWPSASSAWTMTFGQLLEIPKKTRHELRPHCDSLIRIPFLLQFQCFVFLLLQSLRIWINTWRFLNSSMPWKKFIQTLQTMNCRCSGATLTATWPKIWQIWCWFLGESMIGRAPCLKIPGVHGSAPVNVMYLIDRCPWGICWMISVASACIYDIWYTLSILYLLSTHFRWVKDTKLKWIDESSRFASSFEIWTNRKSEKLLNSHCRWWTKSYSAWNGGKVAINLGNLWHELILRILSINGSQFCCLCGTQSRVKRLNTITWYSN